MSQETVSTDELLSVPGDDLAAVIPFRTHGDVRYYLDGVLVDPVPTGGCMVIATEGHMLGAVFSAEAKTDKPRILRVTKELEERLSADPRDNQHRRIFVSDEKAKVILSNSGTEEYVQAGLPFIDGRYPDWRKVIPPIEQIKPGAPATLQARYLAKLWKTVRYHRELGVQFSHDARKPYGAAVLQFVGHPTLIVLIMAMKHDRQNFPEWMPHEKAEAAA